MTKTKETSFIRGDLTFWKCSDCDNWHEGEVHRCPISSANQIIQTLKNELIERDSRINRFHEMYDYLKIKYNGSLDKIKKLEEYIRNANRMPR